LGNSDCWAIRDVVQASRHLTIASQLDFQLSHNSAICERLTDREWREHEKQRQFDALTSAPPDIEIETEMLFRNVPPSQFLVNLPDQDTAGGRRP
jgi:hypothetical protein